MSPSLILAVRSMHVLGAIAMLGGIVARQIVRGEAARTEDVRKFAALAAAASRLDRLLVIPGSASTVILGLVLALLMGAPLLGFLQGADRNWLLAANLIIVSILIVVPSVFVPQGRRLEATLRISLEEGRITSDLKAVLDEPASRLWHLYEGIAGVVVVLLMTLRPF